MRARKHSTEAETELKISLSADDLEKVFKTLSRKSGTASIPHKFLPRMYYDTQDLGLYKNHLSLRVQYKQGKGGRIGSYEQTVKIELKAPTKKGVLRRKECKDDIGSHKPNMAAVANPQARKALKPFKGKKLTHIFTAAIERRYFNLALKAGKKKGLVEVAFDVGQIILAHNNAHRNLFEIEIEIKQGGAEFIEIVKKEIFRLAPSAKIQPLSKSEQGSRFYLKRRA